MRTRLIPWILLALLAAGWIADKTFTADAPGAAGATATISAVATDDPPWTAFELDDLVQQREDSERRYLPFLDASTLSMGLYVPHAGEKDPQPIHKEDEIYYIQRGQATLFVDGDEHPVKPGSVVYVKAGIEHRFYNITDDLYVFVFFSKAPPENAGQH